MKSIRHRSASLHRLIERLESRSYFSSITPDGTLAVNGTSADDIVSIAASGGTLTVTVNGVIETFNAAAVTKLSVALVNGADTFTLGGGVPGGALDLGPGIDTVTVAANNLSGLALSIIGGFDADTVTVQAGAGVPISFDGGSGTDTLNFNGSGGDDTFSVLAASIAGADSSASYTAATTENLVVHGNAGADTFNFAYD